MNFWGGAPIERIRYLKKIFVIMKLYIAKKRIILTAIRPFPQRFNLKQILSLSEQNRACFGRIEAEWDFVRSRRWKTQAL